jgi:hypothetical protein
MRLVVLVGVPGTVLLMRWYRSPNGTLFVQTWAFDCCYRAVTLWCLVLYLVGSVPA